MGLLDGNLDDPQRQMIMALAAGLLMPQGGKNFGANVGSAIPQGLLAYNSARAIQSRDKDAEQQRQMHAMQMAQMQSQAEQQQKIQALGPQFMRQASPQQFAPNDQETPSIPAQPGGMDWKGYSNALTGIDPRQGLQLQSALAQLQARNLQKLGEGDRLVDAGTGQEVASNPKHLGPKEGDVRKFDNNGKSLTYEYTRGEWKKIGETAQFKPDTPEKPPQPHLYDGPTGPVWVTPPARGSANQAVTGPDGKAIDPKKRDQPLTEAQGNATAYAMRAAHSEQMLQQIEAGGHNPAAFPGIRNRMAGGSLNVLAPDAAQQYNAAKQNFVTAVLRKESGAAISQSEFDKEDQKYFPQPGDGPKVRADKQKARELAIESLKIQAGPAGQKAMSGASGGWAIKALD
jgi:hypothetical protein